MAGEESLPNELNKLEIGPLLPQIKFLDQNNLPVTLNPFYNESTIKENPSNSIFKDVHKVKCNCRIRRRSDSVVEKLKTTAIHNKSPVRNYQYDRIIRNCNQFKKTTSNSNVILREPILKAFQHCLHPHNAIRKKGQSSQLSLVDDEIKTNEDEDDCTFNRNCQTIDALNLEDSNELVHKLNEATKLTSKDDEANKNDVTNFRQLIEECQTLLETNVSFSTEVKNHKNSKTFNTMQLPNSRISQKSTDLHPNSNEMNNLKHHLGEQQLLTARSAVNSTASTSCSQQARINMNSSPNEPMQQSSASNASSSSCDVTIDELASYFETLVHIPKKMSTMAEMMYI